MLQKTLPTRRCRRKPETSPVQRVSHLRHVVHRSPPGHLLRGWLRRWATLCRCHSECAARSLWPAEGLGRGRRRCDRTTRLGAKLRHCKVRRTAVREHSERHDDESGGDGASLLVEGHCSDQDEGQIVRGLRCAERRKSKKSKT
uniref:(northern house mosquito) hypothetical protein n=1 Tax=Culex pipiens TaxID=7175 RepID=A0A8D8K5A3_CULPI